ncbi:MAG: glycosyltransferase family 2 protein [Anaerolineales bacterium]|nr:glycosyltransferase family 2 protein [Anaerolineales bacterium]
MSNDSPHVSIIIPAYNEANNIVEIIRKIREVLQGTEHEILVIDDGSGDETSLRAEEAGVKVIRHPYNIGNGASIKTGIRNARGEILVMLDADGQHPPEDIPRLLDKIGPYDMAVGARTSDSDTDLHRNFANTVYNLLASYISGTKVEDLTSGFRAVKAEAGRGFVYLLPNRFSYPTTITLATLRSGRSLVYVPIKGRRRIGKSNIRLLKDGLRFLIIILRIATIYSPLKIFIPASALMFLTGVGYGLFKVIFLNTRYGPTSAMLMTISVVVFMVGLVSEQIAQLRFERSEYFSKE